MKKAIPAFGTKKALAVKRCLILCTGNQMAGKLPTQKRKKLTKSRVLVPELSGMEFGRVCQLDQIDRIMSLTQVPPIQAWTPYQMQAMAARLKTGHNEPQIPKDERATTGKPI